MLRVTLHGRFALSGPDGAEVSLTSRRARALLALLATSPQQSRSREEIMALLWSERGEAQARGSLRQLLSGLRKELGAHAAALSIDAERVALNPERITLAPAEGAEFMAGFHLNDPAFEDWLRDERLRQEAQKKRPDHAEDDPTHADLAVLPFHILPETQEGAAFAEGMTEDILTELSRFTELTVYAPWSSFSYDEERTTEDIGRALEVEYLVEGSVRQSGERLRITAMLFDMETVNHVWVQRFDRQMDDVFAVQDEVAREVATAVSCKIEADAQDWAASCPESARRAIDYVLLGERAQQRDWNASEAVRCFEKAIALDSTCARAIAGLANWHANSSYTDFIPFTKAEAETRRLGEEALMLGPKDAVVLALLADAYAEIGATSLARQCLDKAIALNPNHHKVMGLAAATLPWLGDVDGALSWLERYLRHDPLWQRSAAELGAEVYYMAGQFDDALASLARMSQIPLHLLPLAAAIHAQAGQVPQAEALRRRYEAGLPSGESFDTHVLAPIRASEVAEMIALWCEGFRKAGFHCDP